MECDSYGLDRHRHFHELDTDPVSQNYTELLVIGAVSRDLPATKRTTIQLCCQTIFRRLSLFSLWSSLYHDMPILTIYLSYNTRILTIYLSYNTPILTIYLSYNTRILTIYLSYITPILTIYLSYNTPILTIYLSYNTPIWSSLYHNMPILTI